MLYPFPQRPWSSPEVGFPAASHSVQSFSSIQSFSSVQSKGTAPDFRIFTKTIFFLQAQKNDIAFGEKPPRRVAHVDVLQKKVCDQSALEPPRRTSRGKFRNFPEPPLCIRFSAIPGIGGATLVYHVKRAILAGPFGSKF